MGASDHRPFPGSEFMATDSKPDLLIPAGFLTLGLMVPKYLAHARFITIPQDLRLTYDIALTICDLAQNPQCTELFGRNLTPDL
jgi:hypothetical protein